VLSVQARDIADRPNEVLAGLPQNVRWQLGILVPQMSGRLPLDPDAYTVRMVVESPAETEAEHLQSVEILDSTSGKRVDGVWWLERPDGPGVFIGIEGLMYQRQLWDSPIKYVVKSRGVGPAVTTYWRRLPAPKGSTGKGPVKAVAVRGYHQGADLMAPKGTEVHAVGDATVTFAGFQQGGYGNLIILDHGRGYQTYYAHLSRITPGVKAGAKVLSGEVIGLVGSTGHSTAPHLHFETRKDSKYIDPFDETRQLDFWLLTADDQERLAMELLASNPAVARYGKLDTGERTTTTDDNR
jgi:murein DD-endopeptidase MepM/ murein hydrolase activator NlpD